MAALQTYIDISKASVGIREEAVPGVLEVGVDFDAINITTLALAAEVGELIIRETGRDGPSDHVFTSEHRTGTITAKARHFEHDKLYALGARDTDFPAEVEVVFAGGELEFISLATGGTHLDLEEGGQIVITGNGALAAAVAASSNADLEGMAVRAYGGTVGVNGWSVIGHKIIKAGSPRDVAGDTVLDLYDGHFLATADFGADFTDLSGLNGTLDFGAAIRTKKVTPGGNKSHSLLAYFPDVEKWVAVSGVQFGGPDIAFASRESGVITQTLIGDGYTIITDTDPVGGATQGSIDTTGLTFNPQLLGGASIEAVYLGAAGTTPPVGLDVAGCTISNLQLGAPGPWQPIVDRLGSTGLCGTITGDRNLTFSFDYNFTGEADATDQSRAIQKLGEDKAEVTADLFLVDADGNLGSIRMYGRAKPHTINTVGGESSEVGSASFMLGCFERTLDSGGMVLQHWALGEAEV